MVENLLPADVHLFQQLLKKNLGGLFSPNRPILIARAPGRLDVLGGVADTIHATVVQYPLEEGIIVAAQQRTDRRVLIRNLNLNKDHVLTVEYRIDDLVDAIQKGDWTIVRSPSASPEKSWCSRILAALAMTLSRITEKNDIRGINIALQSSLPYGAGLGASAAQLIALLLLLKEVYSLPGDLAELADTGHMIMRNILQEENGRAEFITILAGERDHLTIVQGQPLKIKATFALPRKLEFWAIDTGVRKTAEGHQLKDVLASLWIGYASLRKSPVDGESGMPGMGEFDKITREDWQRRLKKQVPYRCSGGEALQQHPELDNETAWIDPEKRYLPRNMIEFAIEEEMRVKAFIQLFGEGETELEESRLVEAGALLLDSHLHFSKVCAMVSPEAEWLVSALTAMGPAAGIYGARAMPWGASSSVVVLAQKGCMDALHNLVSRYTSYSGKTPHISNMSSSGAQALGVRTAYYQS